MRSKFRENFRVVRHSSARYEADGGADSDRVTPINDIAIVTLDRVITSKAVSPICLPEVQKSGLPEGQAVVAGWGQVTKHLSGDPVTELIYAPIDVYNTTLCRQKYEDFVDGDNEIFELNEKMICGGNSKSDACKGQASSVSY